jgi:hypothetical protein
MSANHNTSSGLVSTWARARRQLTPRGYSHLRALAAVRFTVSAFLVGLGSVLFTSGHHGWSAVPFAGAVLVFSIAYLDYAAARSADYHA